MSGHELSIDRSEMIRRAAQAAGISDPQILNEFMAYYSEMLMSDMNLKQNYQDVVQMAIDWYRDNCN